MIEILISDFSGGGYVPLPTGPGPTSLVGGNLQAGYYGSIPSSLLTNGTDLATLCGVTTGTLQNSTSDWLKFSSYGKTIFVSKQTIRRNILWTALNSLGCVFGTKEIVIGDYRYKVRLLEGAASDPGTTAGREWDALMYNVSATALSSLGWASFTNAQLTINTGTGTGCATWCQETWTGESGHIHRGYATTEGIARDTSGANYQNYGWRPVLEVVGVA